MTPVSLGSLRCFLAPDRKDMILTRKLSYDSANLDSDLISTTDTDSTHTKPLVYDRYLKQHGWDFQLPSTDEEIRTATREGGTHYGFPDDDARFQTIRRLLYDILTSAGRSICIDHPVAVRATVKGWVQAGYYFKQLFDVKDGFKNICPRYGDDDKGRKVHITRRVRENIATCIQEEVQKLWDLRVKKRDVLMTTPTRDHQVLEYRTEVECDEAASLQHGKDECHQDEHLDCRSNEKRGFYPETAVADRSQPADLQASFHIDKTAGDLQLKIAEPYHSESPEALESSRISEHVSRYDSGVNVCAMEDETTHAVDSGTKPCKRQALNNGNRVTAIGIPYEVVETLESPVRLASLPLPKHGTLNRKMSRAWGRFFMGKDKV